MTNSTSQKLHLFYDAMLRHFGSQDWWPGDGPLETVIGAVLTQNTNWANVEKAITNLRNANLIDIEKLNDIDLPTLASLIKPSGYFNIKAKRLKNLIRHITENYGDRLEELFALPVDSMREELLSVSGIGPETADDIILYAAEKPTFVIDTYTYRIMLRHHLISQEDDYFAIKEVFESNLEDDVKMFNEYHALLVATGKNYCKPRNPKCETCPLNPFDHDASLPENF